MSRAAPMCVESIREYSAQTSSTSGSSVVLGGPSAIQCTACCSGSGARCPPPLLVSRPWDSGTSLSSERAARLPWVTLDARCPFAVSGEGGLDQVPSPSGSPRLQHRGGTRLVDHVGRGVVGGVRGDLCDAMGSGPGESEVPGDLVLVDLEPFLPLGLLSSCCAELAVQA